MMGVSCCTNELLPELSIDSVSIYTESDTNENSAIAVDLVIVYDQELAKLLGQMAAAKYFSSSKQLLLDNPTLLDIWHWELVPGQIVQDFTPPQEEGDAYSAYVFANYLSPGDHRIKVAPTGIVKILLLKDDLKNLAIYDLHDARVGSTMSNVSRTREESGKEEDRPKINLGPIKAPSQICKKMGPKKVPPTIVCPNFQPSKRKPIPIRPLRPPGKIPCNPFQK